MSADIPNQDSMQRLGRLAKTVVQALETGMSTLGVNEDTDVFGDDEEGTGDEKVPDEAEGAEDEHSPENGVTPAAGKEAEVPAESEATPTSESPISLWTLTRKATKALRRQKKVDITLPKAAKVHRSHNADDKHAEDNNSEHKPDMQMQRGATVTVIVYASAPTPGTDIGGMTKQTQAEDRSDQGEDECEGEENPASEIPAR